MLSKLGFCCGEPRQNIGCRMGPALSELKPARADRQAAAEAGSRMTVTTKQQILGAVNLENGLDVLRICGSTPAFIINFV